MSRSGRVDPPALIRCVRCGIEIYPSFSMGLWLHKWGSELCSDARKDQSDFAEPLPSSAGAADE